MPVDAVIASIARERQGVECVVDACRVEGGGVLAGPGRVVELREIERAARLLLCLLGVAGLGALG
jgi:hypothetical protein